MRIKEIILENQSFQFRFFPVVINDDGSYDTKEFEEPLESICGACNGKKKDINGDRCEPCIGKGTVSTNVLRSPIVIVDRGTLEFTEQFFNRNWEEDNLIRPSKFLGIRTKLIDLDDNKINSYEREKKTETILGKTARLPDENGIPKIGKKPDTYIVIPAITKDNILRFKNDFVRVLDFAQEKNIEFWKSNKKNVGIAVEDF